MKKSIAVLLIVLGVLMTGVAVFADANDLPDWFDDMIEWRKAQVQESLNEGLITPEQAEAWNAHFDDMEEFHEEAGFPGLADAMAAVLAAEALVWAKDGIGTKIK